MALLSHLVCSHVLQQTEVPNIPKGTLIHPSYLLQGGIVFILQIPKPLLPDLTFFLPPCPTNPPPSLTRPSGGLSIC